MNDELFIGTRIVYGAESPVGLKTADRRQHVHVLGKTGSGKTTLLRNLLVQHIEAGHGVALIDPHGDLATSLLDCIPPHRTDDLVYFNPADFEFPVGLNVLAKTHPDHHLIASGVVGAFKSIWRESWGPRLEYILHNALLSLIECENTTLLGVTKLLANDRYRAWVVNQIQDPMLKAFWQDEYEQYDPRFRREAIAPIQNKIGQFVTSGPMRNILGQVKNRVDFSDVMDSGKIFIANLSKGHLGEDKTNLLGALLVSQFQLAAMRRVRIPENERRDFFLFVDEFQNFCTDSFATILSEARKFRLNLTLSHQYTDQLPLPIRQAVFGNVGTIISFRIGHTDADVLAKEFGKDFVPTQFADLAPFEMLVKPLVDGDNLAPLRARSLPPQGKRYGRGENLRRCSQEKYAAPRAEVETKINRWLERYQTKAVAPKRRGKGLL